MIEVELPDGTIAEFPADTPHEVIQQALQQRFGGQQPEPTPEQPGGFMATAGDMLSSLGTGLREGVEGIASMPGDLNRLGGQAAEGLAGWLGASPETAQQAGNIAQSMSVFRGMPTSEVTRGQTQELIGDSLTHEPQTTAGEYSRTMGQFVPSAVFGTGGLLQRGAQVALPALGSETAGQLTKDTAAEPYARVAGALAGGVGAGRVGRPKAQTLPTAREIKDSAGYAALKPEMQAAQINRDTYQNIVRTLRQQADDFGMVPEQHRAFESILRRHANKAKQGGASLQDLEVLRRSLAHAGKQPTNPSAGALSRQLTEQLDDQISRLSGGNLAHQSGRTVDDTLTSLREARETWRTGMKSEIIETAMEKAANQASGFENGIRTQFRSILNNKTLSRMFNETEKQAMRQVVKGNFGSNAMRFLGTFGVPIDQGRNWLGAALGGSGVGAMVGSALGSPGLGTAAGVATVGLGTAARAKAASMTRNHALFAEAMVKGGKGAQKIAREALMEMQAARNAGLLRGGTQALTAARSPQAVAN